MQKGGLPVILEFQTGIDETAHNYPWSELQRGLPTIERSLPRRESVATNDCIAELRLLKRRFARQMCDTQRLEIPHERFCLELFNPLLTQRVLCLCQKGFLDLVPDLAERSYVGRRFFFNQHNIKDVAWG